ncbi:hypothetical protein SNE40_007322 [Patella caerulea]|uniref:Programmed cell death protein 4 n=1 Tax=Patella caerulea TaxID=87958 RepID=A0AAN8K4E0_PATCE
MSLKNGKKITPDDDGVQDGDIIVNDMNGNMDNSEDSSNDSNTKDVRSFKKSKKLNLRKSPSTDNNVLITDNHHKIKPTCPQPFTKNSKKSRNGKGRGLPKKGGAGGKGVWGKPGVEMFEDGRCNDSHDPNYDSDNEEKFIVEAIDPPIVKEDFEKIVEPLILEYFEHGDTSAVLTELDCMNLGPSKTKMVELVISMALDRKATHREMTSVLISDLYGKFLTSEEVSTGFDDLLGSLSDLTIDTPDAPIVVGQFIARAVADDCLPPKYISKYKGKLECAKSREALEKADVLLNQRHGIVRLDNIWGTGGGIRPVKSLIKNMVMLLKEYLSSGDIPEATRCLKQLEVPHFHHELVYEAVVMMLENSTNRAMVRMCKLLKSLVTSVIITPDQLVQGFKRVYAAMPDLCLDVPNAYSFLEKFANVSYNESVISAELLKELPQRGRKRFVSEGDGGLLKEVAP